MDIESRILRVRQGNIADRLDRLIDPPRGSSARMVGQVFAVSSVPTATGKYFAVHPVSVSGVESEGSAGVLTVDTNATAYFLVLGTTIPVAGDYLVAKEVNGRWVSQGIPTTTGPALACTPCNLPLVDLTLTLAYQGGGPSGPGFTETYTLTDTTTVPISRPITRCWDSGCVITWFFSQLPLVDVNSPPGFDVQHRGRFVVGCEANLISVYLQDTAGTVDACANLRPAVGNLVYPNAGALSPWVLTSHTCTPFMFQFSTLNYTYRDTTVIATITG